MGLKGRIRDYFIRKEIRSFEGKNMDKIKAVIEWLNAVPGRKRGIAAALLAGAAALRVLGHSDIADGLAGFNDVVQNSVVPGMDLVGFVFAVIGLAHAKARA